MIRRREKNVDSDVSVEEIIKKSQEIFLSTDYHNITIENIAKSLDVSVAAIQKHFKTKDAIYLKLLEIEYIKRLDTLANSEMFGKLKTFDDVKAALMFELEHLITTNPLYIRLEAIRAILLETNNADYNTLLEFTLSVYKILDAVLDKIVETGAVTKPVLHRLLHTQLGLISGCKMVSAIPPRLDEIVNDFGLTGFTAEFKFNLLQSFQLYLDGLGMMIESENTAQ